MFFIMKHDVLTNLLAINGMLVVTVDSASCMACGWPGSTWSFGSITVLGRRCSWILTVRRYGSWIQRPARSCTRRSSWRFWVQHLRHRNRQGRRRCWQRYHTRSTPPPLPEVRPQFRTGPGMYLRAGTYIIRTSLYRLSRSSRYLVRNVAASALVVTTSGRK